jgi:hypothetical protein
MEWVELSEERIASLASAEESELLEFKEQWFDIDHAQGKAELIKAVLALANTVRPEQEAQVLFGVRDRKRGGGVVGISAHPSTEQLAQIFDQYIAQPVDARYTPVKVRDLTVGVLQIRRSAFHPHWSNRDFTGILSTKDFYIRVGPTIGVARPDAIESFFREKAARLGPIRGSPPIQAGFVDEGSQPRYGAITVRVANLTDEPVGGVSVFLDARMPVYPEAFYRGQSRSGMTLAPGQTVEDNFKIGPRDFWCRDGGFKDGEAKIMSTYKDLILRVYYRNRQGVLEVVERHLSITM